MNAELEAIDSEFPEKNELITCNKIKSTEPAKEMFSKVKSVPGKKHHLSIKTIRRTPRNNELCGRVVRKTLRIRAINIKKMVDFSIKTC